MEVIAAAVVWLAPSQSRAEPASNAASSDRVTAQVLFDQGKERLVAGNYDEACPLLEESHRLLPGIGVLLHLALCFEKSNQIASAWAAFQEAADRARAEGDTEREAMARSRAAQLYGKLSFLRLRVLRGGVEVSPSGIHPVGLQIRHDHKPVSLATLGIEIPIDPGQHSVLVTADAMQETTRDITLVAGEHAKLEMELSPRQETRKPLEPRKLLGQPQQPVAHAGLPPSLGHDSPPPRDSAVLGTRWDWSAWMAAGIGAAGLVVGTTSGLLAYSQMKDAREHCAGHAKNDCPSEATQLQESAHASATVATAAFAAGLGCLAFAGGYWLVSRSGRTAVAGWVTPSSGAFSVYSRW